MDKERKRAILSLIECVAKVEGTDMTPDEFVGLITQYGGRFDVTHEEVEKVLGCRVADIVL